MGDQQTASNDLRPQLQKVWIVLPAYNEEQSLPALLEHIEDAMLHAGFGYQVILVNDGSVDATAKIASSFSARIPVLVEQHAVNLGLGATIRDGLSTAARLAQAKDVIVTMDADNSHSPDLIHRMVWSIREGHDVVIASRYREGSSIHGVPFIRRLLSRIAGILFQLAFPITGVRDYTCGFRAYRASVVQVAIGRYGPAFCDQQGFQCMVDILLKLSRQNLISAKYRSSCVTT